MAYAVRAAIATFQVKDVDYVFSISQPPVLGGLLGVWGKLMRRAKFIYNIQDFNPEQVIAVELYQKPADPESHDAAGQIQLQACG